MALDRRGLPASEHGGLALGILFGALAALIWGVTPVVLRFAVEHKLPVGDIVAARFVVSGLILLPFVWRHGTAGLGWPRSLVLACGAGAPVMFVTTIGLDLSPAGHDGVIVPSTTLLVAALFAWLLLDERPKVVQLAGLAVIILGVALIGWDSLDDMGAKTWEGDLLFVVAGILWALYTLGCRAWSVEPLQATALVAVVSLVVYFPIYLLVGEPKLHKAPVGDVLLVGFVNGVLSGILALLCYTRAVKILGAARGAVFNAMVPGLVLLMAYPALGEVPSWLEMLGVVTVTLGMVGALGLIRLGRSD